MARLATLFAATLLAPGCAGAGRLRVDVQPVATQGLDQAVVLTPQPGGVVAEVQFVQAGTIVGPVRLSAARVDGSTVEIGVKYRTRRSKCVSTRAYRVGVRGLEPGAYDVIVTGSGFAIAGEPVVVTTPAPDSASRAIARISQPGC